VKFCHLLFNNTISFIGNKVIDGTAEAKKVENIGTKDQSCC
jgi:hypothetical protein